jgi:hypothetical protein
MYFLYEPSDEIKVTYNVCVSVLQKQRQRKYSSLTAGAKVLTGKEVCMVY